LLFTRAKNAQSPRVVIPVPDPRTSRKLAGTNTSVSRLTSSPIKSAPVTGGVSAGVVAVSAAAPGLDDVFVGGVAGDAASSA
jgi:hypothetical protein